MFEGFPLIGDEFAALIGSPDAGSSGGIDWLFRFEFPSNISAPVGSPYSEGWGSMTLVQSGGQSSITGGELVFGTSGSGYSDLQATILPVGGSPLARKAGRAFITRVRTAGSFLQVGLASAAPAATQIYGIYYDSATNIYAVLGGTTLGPIFSITSNTDLEIAPVLFDPAGAAIFLRNGSDWKLAFVFGELTTTSLYPAYMPWSSVVNVGHARGRDLPASMSSALALAILRTTTFNQSYSSNILGNGGFNSWSSGSPTSWVESSSTPPDPDIIETARNGGAGTGAATFISSATPNAPRLNQDILETGTIYLIGLEVTAFTSGALELQNAGSFVAQFTSTGARRLLRRATGPAFRLLNSSGSCTFTIDDSFIQALTVNTAQTMPSNAIIDFKFTLPASPVAWDEVKVCSRISAPGNEMHDNWEHYLRRNDANTNNDFRVDTLANGVRVNRAATSSVGTPTTIREIADGSLHDYFTLAGSTWTKRGSQLNVSHLNTATGLNTIVSPGVTPSELLVFPRSSGMWNTIFDEVA